MEVVSVLVSSIYGFDNVRGTNAHLSTHLADQIPQFGVPRGHWTFVPEMVIGSEKHIANERSNGRSTHFDILKYTWATHIVRAVKHQLSGTVPTSPIYEFDPEEYSWNFVPFINSGNIIEAQDDFWLVQELLPGGKVYAEKLELASRLEIVDYPVLKEVEI